MDERVIYMFRGWIAFVAFMDMGTAGKCFIEKRSFLGQHNLGDAILPRILGIFSILKAVALVHCTLYIHIAPVVSLGICSLILTIVMYILETMVFNTASVSGAVIFPCVLNALTLIGLIAYQKSLMISTNYSVDDENAELLRQACVGKRKRQRKMD